MQINVKECDATLLRSRHPERVPILMNKRDGDSISDLVKYKYLVPMDMPVSYFLCFLRKKLLLPSHKAVFLFSSGKMVPNSSLVSVVYASEKSDDGFLRLTYGSENCFGF
jgi:GABA(A) receptor-associated protein